MRSNIFPLLLVLILGSALQAFTKQVSVHDGFRVHKRSGGLKASFDYKQTDRGSITRRQHFKSKAELMAREPSRTESIHRRQAQTSPEARVYDLCSARPNVADYTTAGPYARYGQAVARGVNGYATSFQGALTKQQCFTLCDGNAQCRGISWAPQTSGNATPVCYLINDDRWQAGAPSAAQDYASTEFAIKGTCNEVRPFVGTYDARCCDEPA